MEHKETKHKEEMMKKDPYKNLTILLEAKNRFNGLCDQIEEMIKNDPKLTVEDIQNGNNSFYVIVGKFKNDIKHSYDVEFKWPKFHGENNDP